ncbi:dihydrofolate reductase family protein [Candidatus Uhrbacteria bacterium]|nr:dihydrofolate reductase family protein [Candidatus Uhrbacteria bacterium]
MTRPYTTLFLLVSVDGKISTGDTDIMDVDTDYPKIPGVREGLAQYYDLQKETDLFSLNTGRVFAKIGINEKKDEPTKIPVSFVVVDNAPHLTERGITYLAKQAKQLIVATTHASHPAQRLTSTLKNVHIVQYHDTINFADLFLQLKEEYGADRITIQSGGSLNTTLVRDGLVDRILFVIAPALVGGVNTATVMDGESLHTPEDILKIKALEFVQAKPLKHSYVLLEYRVLP